MPEAEETLEISFVKIKRQLASSPLGKPLYWLKAKWQLFSVKLRFYQDEWWPLNSTARSERWALQLLADVDGPLSPLELQWLYKKVNTLPQNARILEINAGAGQVTCCLALACWATRRRVYTCWPMVASKLNTQTEQTYIIWHKNVIRKHLAPYVTPVILNTDSLNPVLPPELADLFFVGNDPLYAESNLIGLMEKPQNLPPAELIVVCGETTSVMGQLQLDSIETIETLTCGKLISD